MIRFTDILLPRNFTIAAVATLLVCAAVATLPAAAQQPGDAAENSAGTDAKDPVVTAILSQPTDTPEQALQVVNNLLALGRPDLAQPIFEKLTKFPLDDAAARDLVKKFGTVALLNLAKVKPFGDQAPQFVENLLSSADRFARDPARLKNLVAELKNPSLFARRQAAEQLLEGREDALKLLFAELAREPQAVIQNRIKELILKFGKKSEKPLLGALESSDPQFKAHVIDMIGQKQYEPAGIYLIVPAIAAKDTAVRQAAQRALQQIYGKAPQGLKAATLVEKQIQLYLSGVRPMTSDAQGNVELWHWNNKKGELYTVQYPVDQVAIVLASRLAHGLYELNPLRTEYRNLYFASELESQRLAAGLEAPLDTAPGSVYARAKALGPKTVDGMLQYSLDRQMYGAATEAARILGEVGDPSLLAAREDGISPLVKALSQGDPTLSFTALRSIMTIDPRSPYAGSSEVAAALKYFASGSGRQRALVGHAIAANGQKIAGLLRTLGYQAASYTNGAQLIRTATKATDYDVLFVDASISKPPVREVLYRLRLDPRTRSLPIGILSSQDRLALAQRIAEDHRMAIALAAPETANKLQFDLDKILALNPRSQTSKQTDVAQTRQAILWIGRLAKQNQKMYDLHELYPVVERASYISLFRREAIEALKNIGTPGAQLALVDAAGGAASEAVRREAVQSFAENVKQNRVLLTTDQINAQYIKYNASETADRATQEILGSVLDALEMFVKKQNQPATKTTAQQ